MAGWMHRGARPRGTSYVLRVASVVVAALAVAGAVVIVLLPLPKPAALGTCGPGKGSESALEAFFDPVTIGAGPASSATTTEEALDRLAFIGECQSATNSRMVDALALLIVGGFFLLVVRPAVHRAWPASPETVAAGAAPSGWYADPGNPSGWRWWDGQAWGQHTSTPVPKHQAADNPPSPPAPSPPPPQATSPPAW